MMALVFSQRADAIREAQGLGKIPETKSPLQSLHTLVFLQRPVWKLRFEFHNVCLGHPWRVAPARSTLFSDQFDHLVPRKAIRFPPHQRSLACAPTARANTA